MRELIEAMVAGNREQIKSITLKLRAMNGWDQATVDRMLEVHDCRESKFYVTSIMTSLHASCFLHNNIYVWVKS